MNICVSIYISFCYITHFQISLLFFVSFYNIFLFYVYGTFC